MMITKSELDLIKKELNINNNNIDIKLMNYINFLYDKIKINKNEFIILLILSLNNNVDMLYNAITLTDFKKIFMNNYKNNLSLLKKFIKIKKRKFDELIDIINTKKRSYTYFEKISLDNMNFYLPIIEYLESIQ